METFVLFFMVALIAFFFLKYFSADNAAPGTDSEAVWVQRNIDQVLVMFPNTPASQIAYDLSRTRSVEATIDKLLSGVQLQRAPTGSRYATWSDSNTTQAPSSPVSSRGTSAASSEPQGPTKDDLIKRYNLEGRVAGDGSGLSETREEALEKYQWSKKREEREVTLRRRKEDAILAARRKLQQQNTTT